MKKINRRINSGFTLIEILISFGIFAILMGIVLSGFMETRKHERLKQSAAELVSTLQKAQNYALTGYVTAGSVPVGGYGVHFDLASTEYFIFADTYSLNSSSVCDSTQGNQRYDPAYDPPCPNEKKAGSSNFLESGVIIHKILVGSSASVTDISFKSPLRMPYVGTSILKEDRNPGDTSTQSVDIYLKWKDKEICRKVSVKGNTGQVTEGTAPCPN